MFLVSSEDKTQWIPKEHAILSADSACRCDDSDPGRSQILPYLHEPGSVSDSLPISCGTESEYFDYEKRPLKEFSLE